MSDLVGFLRARLDEDEGKATAALPWSTGSRDEGQPYDWVLLMRGPAHPARVLAEVAAKRAVLDDYQIILANNAVERATKPDDVRDAIQGLMVKTLRMVLLRWVRVHASHPDFDLAWKVES